MKNIIKIIATAFLVAIFTSIVLVGTKSQLGNPTITELNTPTWTESGPLELSPERARFALLYSIIENKSFQFDTETARLATPDLGYKNGQFVSLFAPGTSLLMIPGYIMGKALGGTHLGATLTIGFFALLNTWIIYLIGRRLGASPVASIIGSFVFIAATPAFTYSGVIYQHHISTFTILLTLLLSIMPAVPWRLAIIYFMLGISIIIDYPNAFFMFPIIVYATSQFFAYIDIVNRIKLRFNPAIFVSAVTVVIPLSLYLAINYMSYGNVLQLSNTVSHIQALDPSGNPVAARGADTRAQSDIQNLESRKRNAFNFFKSRHLINGLYAFSVSPDRGILVFTPVIILGFLGLITLYRTNPRLTQTLLAVVCLNILLYGMRSDPWGGWAFGPRYLIPAFSILAITLALAVAHYRRNVFFLLLLLTLGGYSIYVNTAGAISSTANPPEVEVLGLEALTGRRERYSFDRNLELLQNGKSKSYIYKTYLKNKISTQTYFKLISGILTGIFSILCIMEIARKRT